MKCIFSLFSLLFVASSISMIFLLDGNDAYCLLLYFFIFRKEAIKFACLQKNM